MAFLLAHILCTSAVPYVSVRNVDLPAHRKATLSPKVEERPLPYPPLPLNPTLLGIISSATSFQKLLLVPQGNGASFLPKSQVLCSYFLVSLSTSSSPQPQEKVPEGSTGCTPLNTNTSSQEALPSRTPAQQPHPRAQDSGGASVRLQLGPGERSSTQSDLLGYNLQLENRLYSLLAGKTQKKGGIDSFDGTLSRTEAPGRVPEQGCSFKVPS